jgi:hypothetical protein
MSMTVLRVAAIVSDSVSCDGISYTYLLVQLNDLRQLGKEIIVDRNLALKTTPLVNI